MLPGRSAALCSGPLAISFVWQICTYWLETNAQTFATPLTPQRPLLQQLRSLRCLPLALCKFNRAIFMTRQMEERGGRERKVSTKMYLLKCEMYVVLVYFEEDKEKGSNSTKERKKKQ